MTTRKTDYVALSTMLHAREPLLLNQERRERMLEAASAAEALKVLEECGYSVPQELTLASLEEMLTEARVSLHEEMREAAPDPKVVELFELKQDYHNIKVLLKAKNKNDAQRLLTPGGRETAAELQACLDRGELHFLSPVLEEAILRAQEILAEGGDPQQADILLDQAYFTEMQQLAGDEPFLQSYVALLADVTNLRTLVRVSRMGRDTEFLDRALLPQGKVSPQTLIAMKGPALAELYKGEVLAEAGELAAQTLAEGGSLTALERACDNGINAFFDRAQRASFGVEVLLGYLYAREAEETAIRTLLSGRLAGLEADAVRARLRTPYC